MRGKPVAPALRPFRPDELASLLLARFAELSAASAPNTLPDSPLRVEQYVTTRNSITYRVQSSFLSFPLLVKQTGSEQAQLEFSALQQIYACLGSTPFSVPRPVACLSGPGLLCMEWIDGRDLRTLLAAHREPVSARTMMVARAGEWLGRFHRTSDEQHRTIDVAGLLEQVDRYRSLATSAGVDDPLLQTVRQWLGDHVREVERIAIAFGPVHGDYKPENVILGGERTFGIDIAAFPGTQLMDIAQFGNHLLLLRLHPRSLRTWQHVESWTDEFLAAYERHGWPIARLPLRWLRVSHMFGLWVTERVRTNLFGRLQARGMRRELTRLLSHSINV